MVGLFIRRKSYEDSNPPHLFEANGVDRRRKRSAGHFPATSGFCDGRRISGADTRESEAAAIAAIAQQYMTKYNAPGLSVAIARHGQFVYQKGFGYADKAAGERVTPASLFRIASVSKPITSVAIFCLIEQGRLGLDDLIFGAQGLFKFDYGKDYPRLSTR